MFFVVAMKVYAMLVLKYYVGAWHAWIVLHLKTREFKAGCLNQWSTMNKLAELWSPRMLEH